MGLQDEREAVLRPGTGALFDASRPYQLSFPADSREIVLQIPRQPLRDRVADIDELSGRALPADHPAARVLAAFLHELAGVSQELAPEQRAELGWTTVDLLATTLRATAGREPTAPTGRQALLQAMRSCALENLTDSAFTPTVLARRQGISLRYAADLFAEAGTSPAAYLRDQRLTAVGVQPVRAGLMPGLMQRQLSAARTPGFRWQASAGITWRSGCDSHSPRCCRIPATRAVSYRTPRGKSG